SHVGTGRFYQWIHEGVVRKLPELSNWPNLKARVEDDFVSVYDVDGEHYFFPRWDSDGPDNFLHYGLLYRKDWAKELGLGVPSNEEEFIAMAMAFTQDDPNKSGSNDTIGFGWDEIWPYGEGGFMNYGFISTEWIKNEETGPWEIPADTEELIPLMDFLRRLYKMGGIDPDFATRATYDIRDMFAAGSVGIFLKQNTASHLIGMYTPWQTAQPDKDFLECVGFIPLWHQEKPIIRIYRGDWWSESYFDHKVDDEKMTRILDLYSWMYTEEGQITMSYGMDGVDYKIEDDGEITVLREKNDDGTYPGLVLKYPFAAAVSLACWPGDILQYKNPVIPKELRMFSYNERERKKADYTYFPIDAAVRAIDVPEKADNTADLKDGFTRIVMDSSDKTTAELYAEVRQEWDSQGYKAMVEAVNAVAAELGK
ncbi:MAG: hypothetical protein FWG13_02665, partial [Leptospirales bacterium]|nr:hypothetical protein [Leptospirales bacterium]